MKLQWMNQVEDWAEERRLQNNIKEIKVISIAILIALLVLSLVTVYCIRTQGLDACQIVQPHK
jgi:uncharacterized membrane protein YvbJ